MEGLMVGDAIDRLGLVRDFVNTLDLEEEKESVPTPEALAAWLAGRGLLSNDERISADEHSLALATRERIRRMLLANNGEPSHPEDLEALDSLAAEAAVTARFRSGGMRLEPRATGTVGALGRILAVIAEAMAEGNWTRLKACSSHTCQWAFFDRSKNHSAHWCSMQTCGNRAKARQFRQRRRAGEP